MRSRSPSPSGWANPSPRRGGIDLHDQPRARTGGALCLRAATGRASARAGATATVPPRVAVALAARRANRAGAARDGPAEGASLGALRLWTLALARAPQ